MAQHYALPWSQAKGCLHQKYIYPRVLAWMCGAQHRPTQQLEGLVEMQLLPARMPSGCGRWSAAALPFRL